MFHFSLDRFEIHVHAGPASLTHIEPKPNF